MPAPARSGAALAAWCVVAAFGTYFCMYLFRKPFTAAGFGGQEFAGVGFKTVLVVAQVFGYTVAKFLGIKVVAEAPPHRRAAALLALIAGAELALVLFGLTPAPWNMVWLFANGLSLGMVFGLVLGFLEGRQNTELLTAGLCTSFIVASGAAKTLGTQLLAAGVPEAWMPAAAGLLAGPPLVGFVWMLSRVPGPTAADIAARSARPPIDGADRWALFRRYAAGLTLLALAYLLITVLRSVRDDFAPEIWRGLTGEGAGSGVFLRSETWVGAGVLALNGAAVLVADNRRALLGALALAAAGPALIAAALLGLQAGWLAPFPFVVLHGLGLYIPYIAVHTTIFERFIALTRDRGNVGYLMYLVDSVGYLGYVAVLLAKEAVGKAGVPAAGEFLGFFVTLSWVVAGGCVVLLVPCWWYFARHPATQRPVVA